MRLREERIFNHRADGVVDREVELLHPRGITGRCEDGKITQGSELSTTLPGKGNGFKPECLCGGNCMNQILRIPGCANRQKDVTGFTKGDYLLGEGISWIVVIGKGSMKANHRGEGEGG